MDIKIFENHGNLSEFTLALDLEGTLISNAVSQFPCLNLFQFLEDCKTTFGKLVMYTTVPDYIFRKVAETLIREEDAPSWFKDLECVKWNPGEETKKDLRKVFEDWEKVIILDDIESYILEVQKSNWIKAEPLFMMI